MKNYGTLYETDVLLSAASYLLQAAGMWLFALAVGVIVVVNSNDFTFGLLSSFGLCVVAAGCFRVAERWR
jgi:hypothetical protein